MYDASTKWHRSSELHLVATGRPWRHSTLSSLNSVSTESCKASSILDFLVQCDKVLGALAGSDYLNENCRYAKMEVLDEICLHRRPWINYNCKMKRMKSWLPALSDVTDVLPWTWCKQINDCSPSSEHDLQNTGGEDSDSIACSTDVRSFVPISHSWGKIFWWDARMLWWQSCNTKFWAPCSIVLI